MSKIVLSNVRIFIEGFIIGLIASLIGRTATIVATAGLIVFFVITALALVVLKKHQWKSYFIGVVLTEAGFNTALLLHTVLALLAIK